MNFYYIGFYGLFEVELKKLEIRERLFIREIIFN